MPERPGGSLAKRPLHFIWMLDCSGSMQGKKIETLNYAIREAIKPMQDMADENPNAEVLVRVIKFSDGAQWHIAQPTEVHNFKWTDLNANGVTDMGKALAMVADALRLENMPDRGLPPVLVLTSDGQPTDDFNSGLKALMDRPWGRKSVRISVAIGEDADLEVLQEFIGNPEIKPLVASNVQDLVKKIKWASTVPLKAASNPHSRTKDASGIRSNVPVPASRRRYGDQSQRCVLRPDAGGSMSRRSNSSWEVIGQSVRGASHLRYQLPNQDAIGFRLGNSGGAPVVLAVSDGHGSPKSFRSSTGSRFAVEVAIEMTTEFLGSVKDSSASAIKNAAERFLTTDIVKAWEQKVAEHLRDNPFTSNELDRLELEVGHSARLAVLGDGRHSLEYGATLLLIAIGEDYVFYLQLGDGDILAVSDRTRQVEHPIPPDATLLANETASLCMDGAHKLFRFRFQHTQNLPPALILASTDGYSNSFSTTGDFDKVGRDLLEITQTEGLERIKRELPSWLDEASRVGSGDDVTLGIVCRRDVIGMGSGGDVPIREIDGGRIPITDRAEGESA